MTCPFATLAEPPLCEHEWVVYYSQELQAEKHKCPVCGAYVLWTNEQKMLGGQSADTDWRGPEWEPNAWIDWLRDDRPAPRAE